MQACFEAVAGHREMQFFRCRRNHHRVEVFDFEQLVIVIGGGFGIARLGDFGEALGAGFDDVQILDCRVDGAGVCANAAAPAGADDAYVDLFHSVSLLVRAVRRVADAQCMTAPW